MHKASFSVATTSYMQLVDITAQVSAAVKESVSDRTDTS